MKRAISKFLVGVLAASGLTGCASAPSAEQIQNADYGAPANQEEAEQLAKNWLQGRLKDPYTAVYQWSPVYRGWMKDPPLLGGKMSAGYILEGSVNAKNGFGGYVGARPYKFIVHNGALAAVYSADNDTGVMMRVF